MSPVNCSSDATPDRLPSALPALEAWPVEALMPESFFSIFGSEWVFYLAIEAVQVTA